MRIHKFSSSAANVNDSALL